MSLLIQPPDPQVLFAPPDYQNHWREEITDEDYHADKTAINSSSLKRMIKSPRAFHAAFFLGKTEEPTKQMKFGTLAHMAILQGSKFKEQYVVMPEFSAPTQKGEMSKQSKAAKEMRAQWLSELPPGTIVVTEDEREDIFGMIDSILSHDKAYALLKDGKPEIAGYWRDPVTGLRLRMKADFLAFKLGALVDVKTTQDCRWEEFRRSVEGLRYDLQIEMYGEGVERITGKKPEHKVWLAVESKFPYEVACHEVPPQYEATGQYEFRSCLNRIKQCIANGSWPQAQADIEFGEMSSWFYKRYDVRGCFNDTHI